IRDWSVTGVQTCALPIYDMQVKTVQYGLGRRGPLSPVTGELACGDETLSDGELRKNRSEFGDEILAHPLDDDYHKARSPVWEKRSEERRVGKEWSTRRAP